MISKRALLASRCALKCKSSSPLQVVLPVASYQAVSRHLSIAPDPIARLNLASIRQTLRQRHTPSSIRFASTSASAVSPSASSIASPPASPPAALPPIDTLATSTETWAPTLDGIAFESVPITAHIGFMKELGLNFGWGPTSLMQMILESVYVYTGLPWWGSIAATACIVRFAMLKFYIDAADTSARMSVLTPYLAPVMERVAAAKKTGDTAALAIASTEASKVYRRAGVKRWKMFAPMLAVPLGYGTFVLLRRMAALPVPGLDEGGFLWIKDLTVADPYYSLPLLTAFFIYRTIKVSGGGSADGAPATMAISPKIRQALLYGLPAVTTLFMMAWPACLQLSFAVQSMLALANGTLLQKPYVRKFLGIQPLVKPSPAGDAGGAQYSGTLTRAPELPREPLLEEETKRGGISGAIIDVKAKAGDIFQKAKEIADKTEKKKGRLTAAEMRSAQAYEAKRKRELELQKLREESDREGRRKARKLRE